MELFIFIAFQLLIEVQSNSSLQKPFISVNGDGVQINIACEIPDPVRADFTCSLYTEDDLLHSQRKQSGERLCVFYVTPGELFTRSVNRQLSCDYSLNTEPEIRSPGSDTITVRGQKSSPHSDPVTVKVQSSTTTTTAQTTTIATARPTTTTSTARTTTTITKAHPTTTPTTTTTTAQTTTTAMTSISIVTSTLPDIRSMSGHVSWLSVVLVFTGVGLFLSGLMGFICLFNSSDDLLTEVNYSSCQVETTSLLTSSVCSKKHG
ncbi:uncharacterized protein [Chanodichthys erythropterus]|uniref:uncharacterized protein isoform X1 n=1 Tax=Chanodichthys erythropterus TaxID=933992 RepID=UPI00351F6F82